MHQGGEEGGHKAGHWMHDSLGKGGRMTGHQARGRLDLNASGREGGRHEAGCWMHSNLGKGEHTAGRQVRGGLEGGCGQVSGARQS